MNTATPKAASGRSKLHAEDLPFRVSWAAGSGSLDRNHWEIERSGPEVGSGRSDRNHWEIERSGPEVGSGRSDRNHRKIDRSLSEAGSGRNRSETERSMPAA